MAKHSPIMKTSSSTRLTRTASSSKITTNAPFKMGIAKALLNKLSSCQRKDPFSIISTKGGFRLFFQAGFFEVFKACILATHANMHAGSVITNRLDANQRAFACTLSIPEKYTLNLYLAPSSALLNGKDTDTFFKIHLPFILESIKASFPNRQALLALNKEVADLLEQWKDGQLLSTDTHNTSTISDPKMCNHCSLPNDKRSMTCERCSLVSHRSCAGRKRYDTLCTPCSDLQTIQPSSPSTANDDAYSDDQPSIAVTGTDDDDSHEMIVPTTIASTSGEENSTLADPCPSRDPTLIIATTDDNTRTYNVHFPEVPHHKPSLSHEQDEAIKRARELDQLARERERATKQAEQQASVRYVKGLEAKVKELESQITRQHKNPTRSNARVSNATSATDLQAPQITPISPVASVPSNSQVLEMMNIINLKVDYITSILSREHPSAHQPQPQPAVVHLACQPTCPQHHLVGGHQHQAPPQSIHTTVQLPQWVSQWQPAAQQSTHNVPQRVVHFSTHIPPPPPEQPHNGPPTRQNQWTPAQNEAFRQEQVPHVPNSHAHFLQPMQQDQPTHLHWEPAQTQPQNRQPQYTHPQYTARHPDRASQHETEHTTRPVPTGQLKANAGQLQNGLYPTPPHAHQQPPSDALSNSLRSDQQAAATSARRSHRPSSSMRQEPDDCNAPDNPRRIDLTTNHDTNLTLSTPSPMSTQNKVLRSTHSHPSYSSHRPVGWTEYVDRDTPDNTCHSDLTTINVENLSDRRPSNKRTHSESSEPIKKASSAVSKNSYRRSSLFFYRRASCGVVL